tara:strand:- start:61 stop:291 length:231 start_codon:yes stop_codon:yes gene_type:complete
MEIKMDMAPQVYMFRALATRAALKLWNKRGIRPNRRTTKRTLLDIATVYTGVKYKNSKKSSEQAYNDLTLWIESNS